MDPCAAIERILAGTSEALTVTEIIADFPDLAELADLFTEGKPKGSREYRAARRRFERYRRGILGLGGETRRPRANDPALERFRDRRRERRRRMASQGLSGTIRGEIKVSNDLRRRAVRVSLSGECVDELLELRDAGADCEELLEHFEECLGVENFGGQVPELGDLDTLDLS